MFISTIFAIVLTIHFANADETCIRPKTIVDNEEQCLDGTTTFLERVQHRATGIFNLAKKKLGVDPEAENEPLKCDYYSCVFQQMIVTNENNVLEKDKLKTWISNNVPSVYKKELVAHADDCYDKFRKTDTYLSIQDDKQRSCEESMEMMKCLHLYKCSVFKFP